MSIFHDVEAVCASCGQRSSVQRTASVNADRRPDLRAAILAGTFQREACPHCGASMRLPPHLTYLDVGRGQWFAVEPSGAIGQWSEVEQATRETWERAFGAAATPHGRELGAALQARLVLGWPALREKLLAAELGLDDLTLELLKLELLRDMGSAPLADQTELRLVAGDAQLLRLDWLELGSERALEGVEVERAAYDAVAEAPDDWAELRARFDGALLVDWRRLTFVGEAA